MSAIYNTATTAAVAAGNINNVNLVHPAPVVKPMLAGGSLSVLESLADNAQAPQAEPQFHHPAANNCSESDDDSEMIEEDDEEVADEEGELIGRIIRVADLQLRLVSVLGSGAYGTVYLAFDRITAQAYAVKHLPEAHLTPAQRRLQRIEASLHARCSGHPNVLPLHHVVPHYPGVDGWFMVLEYCSDGDLFEYINDGRLGQRTLERESRRLLEEIISAVEWCHSRGVYHRDIKPENVLMRRGSDGRMHVYLADFGLATTDAWSNEHGCGSTFYMSPESRSTASAAPYATGPSDVWSVAVLLVNLTCARNPWRRAERQDGTFASFLRSPVATLTQALPITEEFARVLTCCFDPNPSRRCTLAELRRIMRNCPRIRRDIPATNLHINVPSRHAPVATAAAPVAAVIQNDVPAPQSPQATPPASPSTISPAMSISSEQSSPSVGSPTTPGTPIGERGQSPVTVTVALPGWQTNPATAAFTEEKSAQKVAPTALALLPPHPQKNSSNNTDKSTKASKSTSSGKSSRKSSRLSAKSVVNAVAGNPGLTNALKVYRQHIMSILDGVRPARRQYA